MKLTQKVGFTLFSGLLMLLVCGCSSDDMSGNKQIKAMREDFKRLKNPESAIPKVREYASEKLSDITNQELELISREKPVIRHNYDGTEYSFVWKNKEGQNIEVLTTPPPCEPIAVYRVRRVYYP